MPAAIIVQSHEQSPAKCASPAPASSSIRPHLLSSAGIGVQGIYQATTTGCYPVYTFDGAILWTNILSISSVRIEERS
jgi:hypothetical protein